MHLHLYLPYLAAHLSIFQKSVSFHELAGMHAFSFLMLNILSI